MDGQLTGGYTIDEAAARTGLSKHTLRYYDREGLLPPVTRATSGHRRYSDDDLGWVRTQRVDVLTRYREALVERMAQDVEHLEHLHRKIDYYAA